MKYFAAVTALCATFAVTANAADPRLEAREAHMLAGANITLPQAVSTAERKDQGHAISVGFDPKHGNEGRYQVTVLAGDGTRLTRLDVDAFNGTVTEAWNRPSREMISDGDAQLIRDMPTSLAGAILTAEERAGGKATDAALARAGNRLTYTVDVAGTDGSTRQVEVGAQG